MRTTTSRRCVEIGRVVLIVRGEHAGKLAVIINIIDPRRVLIDGPRSVTGVRRGVACLKGLELTRYKVNISRGQHGASLAKVVAASNVPTKFSQSAWGRRLATRAARSSLTDFDRVMLAHARRARAQLVAKRFFKAVKAAKAAKGEAKPAKGGKGAAPAKAAPKAAAKAAGKAAAKAK